jgi:hypothetical protein
MTNPIKTVRLMEKSYYIGRKTRDGRIELMPEFRDYAVAGITEAGPPYTTTNIGAARKKAQKSGNPWKVYEMTLKEI